MPLKLLHTSDWHLGKRLHKLERLPEQLLFLDWLVETLKQQNIDHLLIAGDVFDVPQPPHKALRAFYDFLGRVTRETSATVWVVAGNHDAGNLLEAPEALWDRGRVRVWGGIRENPQDHWVQLPFPGQRHHLDLCVLPYFRHHELGPWREIYGGEVVAQDWPEQMVRAFLANPPKHPQAVGKIFMGHHLFGLFEAAGSEQALALSGLDSIPLDWLASFDYAALGHIHKPQTLRAAKPQVWYCGSPIAMRFSETAPKRVNLLTWESDSTFQCQALAVPVWRELVSLVATGEDWQEQLRSVARTSEGQLAPAIEIELHLPAPVPGLLEQIRAEAQALGVEDLTLLPTFAPAAEEDRGQDWTTLLRLGPLELFESFYRAKYPEEPAVPADLLADLKALMEEARRAPPST
jgi:exonuclease SbcD